MSAKHMGQVFDLDLPHAPMLVLLALADHADHNGESIFPSIGLIAWKTGYSKRQVIRIMQDLKRDGILAYQQTLAKGIKLYALNLSAAPTKPPFKRGTLRGDKMSSCTDVQGDKPDSGGDIAVSPDPSVDPSKENTQTAHAREDEPLLGQIPVKQTHEDETPCVCEDESMPEEPEALPEPHSEAFAWEALTCGYDPAFPCEHQQEVAQVIAPIVGNYVRVKASDVPVEVAHEWTVPEVTLLYDWLTQVKAPDDAAWWRLRNAFSPTHRDDNLCMAKEWAAKRDAKRSAAVCPHPPNRIGYNPMLAQYHCFGCFRDVPLDVAAALGCDEHLDIEPETPTLRC